MHLYILLYIDIVSYSYTSAIFKYKIRYTVYYNTLVYIYICLSCLFFLILYLCYFQVYWLRKYNKDVHIVICNFSYTHTYNNRAQCICIQYSNFSSLYIYICSNKHIKYSIYTIYTCVHLQQKYIYCTIDFVLLSHFQTCFTYHDMYTNRKNK